MSDVWGLMPKAQDDDELITEAIAAAIAAHEADEAAHLGVGESLQSHKASEIIDHAAASIVNDKLSDGSVDLMKLMSTKYLYISNFSDVSSWNGNDQTHGYYSYVPFEFLLGTYAYADGWNVVCHEPSAGSAVIDFAKNPVFQTTFKTISNTNQTLRFGIGAPDDKRFGFKIVGGTLYASHHNGSTETTTEISGITITNYNVYRAFFDNTNSQILFYVNGVLKATHTTNLPSGTSTFMIHYELTNDGANARAVYMRDLLLTCDR